MYHRLAGRPFVSLLIILIVVLVGIGVRDVTIQAFLILPLILILPGYALTAAIFPDQELDASERLAMALGLGFAITVVGGVLFFLLQISFRASSWAILLGGLMLFSSLVALVRRRKRIHSKALRDPRKLGIGGIVLFGMATLTLVGAFRSAQIGADQQPFADFTQLWILPTAQNERKAVQLGIFNGETEKINYRLQLNIGNQILAEWEPLTLDPEESWETTFVLPIDTNAHAVGARLFRLDDPRTPYRYVWLRFNKGEYEHDISNSDGHRPLSTTAGRLSTSDTAAQSTTGETWP